MEPKFYYRKLKESYEFTMILNDEVIHLGNNIKIATLKAIEIIKTEIDIEFQYKK
jgi:hypothetical protein